MVEPGYNITAATQELTNKRRQQRAPVKNKRTRKTTEEAKKTKKLTPVPPNMAIAVWIALVRGEHRTTLGVGESPSIDCRARRTSACPLEDRLKMQSSGVTGREAGVNPRIYTGPSLEKYPLRKSYKNRFVLFYKPLRPLPNTTV